MRPVLLALLALAGPALAQMPQGPIRDGRDYEPNPGATAAREREAGVAPSAQRDRAETSEVERLYRELTQPDAGGTAPPGQPAPPRRPSTPPR